MRAEIIARNWVFYVRPRRPRLLGTMCDSDKCNEHSHRPHANINRCNWILICLEPAQSTESWVYGVHNMFAGNMCYRCNLRLRCATVLQSLLRQQWEQRKYPPQFVDRYTTGGNLYNYNDSFASWTLHVTQPKCGWNNTKCDHTLCVRFHWLRLKEMFCKLDVPGVLRLALV